MTDLLTTQAEIKARHRPIRDASGQFARADLIARVDAMRCARKSALKAELIARGLLPAAPPPGCVKVSQHIRHVHSEPARQAALL